MAWQYIKGRWWIFALATVPVMLVGAALIIIDMTAETSPSLGRHWYESFTFLGIFFIASPIASILLITGFVRRGQNRENAILERSVPGRATVISASETGLYTNNVPQLELTLDVETDIQPLYRLVHREHVSLLNLHKISPGSVISVLVDSENRENILLNL